MARRALHLLALPVALAAVALAVRAAPPALPATIPYQGLLLDAGGVPRTGPVDLTLRIYDALTGGTLLYKQTLLSVPLADGVFSVTLGPSGSATDTPVNPLTTSLATALAGDLSGTGPSRFLEITVGATGALARTQLLSVPYALHAGSADTATSAQSATTATDVSNVNGVPAAVLSEIFQHVDFDGGVPPNDSPLEGIADADGDGIANFLDTDNDGDGFTDVAEVGGGSDINLVTPLVANVSPLSYFSFLTTPVTVTGQNFQPGLSVVFGSQSPTPTGITPTSFQVTVGPQPAGPVNVVVTLPNGQSDGFTGASFVDFASGTSHGLTLPAGAQLSFDLTAAFVPVVGGQNAFARDFDTDGDFDVGTLSGAGATAVGYEPNDILAGLRCRPTSSFNCALELIFDTNADGALGTGDVARSVETLGSSPPPSVNGPSFEYDGIGRLVVGYVKVGPTHTATVARDLNLDGDFTDAGEIRNVVVLGGSSGVGGDLALDASGRPAYAFLDTTTGNLRVAHDRNGDGDYSDTITGNPELRSVVTGPVTCFGVSFDDGARLAMVWDAGAGTVLARDGNDDGDFGDAGEVVTLAPGPAQGCDVDGRVGGGLAVAHDGDDLRLLIDRDDDGAFTTAGEDLPLEPAGVGTHPVRVRQRGTTTAVATGAKFFFDPLLAP